MKKKILFASAFFLFLFTFQLLSPAQSRGACNPTQSYPGFGGGCLIITCNVGGKVYCCDTQAECNNLRGGTGDTNQPLDLEQIQASAFPNAKYSTSVTIGKIISDILPYIFAISGILLLLYFLMGGLQLMLSAGDPKKAQGAWGKITNAVIGFVIIFIAYWLTQLIGNIFNIQIIKDIFK